MYNHVHNIMKANICKLVLFFFIKAILFIPIPAFAYTFYTWSPYSLGSASISDKGVFQLTGISNLYFSATTSASNPYTPFTGGGGITGATYPYNTLNNAIYANFGVGTWHGAVCFGPSGAYPNDLCFIAGVRDNSRWVNYLITVTGTDTPALPNNSITYATSTTCTSDPSTRIISFTPENNATTTNPVPFEVRACVNSDDLSTIEGVQIRLHNIDQNVLFLGSLSPSDIVLLDTGVDTGGDFEFSTSTTLGEGNYRIEACINRTYFGYGAGSLFGYAFALNPFADIHNCQSHQFIVGTSTFIGNISQRIWGETNSALNGLSATSSEALARTCNPLGSSFDIRQCLAFLFIPDGQSLTSAFEDAKTGILTRMPWGYLTRFIVILSATSTSPLPSFTTVVQVGAGGDLTPATTSITMDMNDMITGGASVLDSIHDPIQGKSMRDVMYPIIQLIVALAVIITIIADIVKMSKSNSQHNVS